MYNILYNDINIAVGIFYFTVGNKPPKAKSQLKSIYLLCVLKHKYLCKYGMDEVIKPFIEDMKKLVRCIYIYSLVDTSFIPKLGSRN